jgi:hypothetical protein
MRVDEKEGALRRRRENKRKGRLVVEENER